MSGIWRNFPPLWCWERCALPRDMGYFYGEGWPPSAVNPLSVFKNNIFHVLIQFVVFSMFFPAPYDPRCCGAVNLLSIQSFFPQSEDTHLIYPHNMPATLVNLAVALIMFPRQCSPNGYTRFERNKHARYPSTLPISLYSYVPPVLSYAAHPILTLTPQLALHQQGQKNCFPWCVGWVREMMLTL